MGRIIFMRYEKTFKKPYFSNGNRHRVKFQDNTKLLGVSCISVSTTALPHFPKEKK